MCDIKRTNLRYMQIYIKNFWRLEEAMKKHFKIITVKGKEQKQCSKNIEK